MGQRRKRTQRECGRDSVIKQEIGKLVSFIAVVHPSSLQQDLLLPSPAPVTFPTM